MAPELSRLLPQIKEAERILLVTHLQPDGDAIGSMLALNELLKRFNKETLMLCQDPVPQNLRILPGWQNVKNAADYKALGQPQFDLAIAVDASDYARMGDCGPFFSSCPKTIKIDHHVTNEQFAQINYVDVEVAASGVLICRLFDAFDQPFSREAALCLYASLSTDTGNFNHGKMTAEFFGFMARLMEADLPIVEAARVLHLVKYPAFIRILGHCLESLRYYADKRLTVMTLRKSDFAELDANMEQVEGVVNYGLNIAGVEITFLATETNEGVKMSLRCIPPHNVAKAAQHFGGGGHVLASGCTIKEPFDKAVDMMRTYLEGLLQ